MAVESLRIVQWPNLRWTGVGGCRQFGHNATAHRSQLVNTGAGRALGVRVTGSEAAGGPEGQRAGSGCQSEVLSPCRT